MGALPQSGGVISNQSGAYGGFQSGASGATGNVGEDPYALEVFNMSAQERLLNPAMRNIDVNPTNVTYDINLNNATAPMQAAAPQFADPFAPQIPQSTIPQGL